MKQINELVKEMEQEAQTTRKMLSIIPDDKLEWQPHPKSMNMRRLASHIAELPLWVTMAIESDGLDFSTAPYVERDLKNTQALLHFFEQSLADGKKHLEYANELDFDKQWILRNGDEILFDSTKMGIIRMTYCQIVHHRAQLGVYLRLLNIPIPGSYGPSADEMGL